MTRNIPPELETLLGVVSACVDEGGHLVAANAGFMRLLPPDLPHTPGMNVARFFIQPDFSSLSQKPSGPNGLVYSGLLTIGDFADKTRTLRARVWREDAQLNLLADFEIAILEHMSETVLELNQAYSGMHIELAHNNLKLKQNKVQLEQTVAELQEANHKLAQAQSQLVQSEKLASVGLLAAGVAHEINTPLGFVNSNFGTLRTYINDLLAIIDAYEAALPPTDSGVADLTAVEALKQKVDLAYLKEDMPSLLKESLQGLDRVKRIVKGLNDFARVDTTDVWERVNLNECLDGIVDLFWGQFSPYCELHKDYSEVPSVPCVASQISQVFMNLLVNAGQSVHDHGTVTLRTGYVSDQAWVEVSDTGCGISVEDQKLIFDPFFTTKPVGQGTGLGLSVAMGVVSKHQGRIEVQSKVGQGSVFRVWLPLHPSLGITHRPAMDGLHRAGVVGE
ncbi:adaptive-response sensory-kinase SasA [Rhodoferax lithotrophicus]|uniref:histidine kinase n=1 Tax=Rhodoferax lithotrophicus TaxID=2798804 RepID=A0ABM7MHL8_9BURK|nr:ATP-binding protein [Rhodoferax sp. MIZ03]BCO25677.1 adaptive-response sensory-kinase SasA [Rhodoferax sp. MIZ03]